MRKNELSTFDCPVCGNPLFMSRKKNVTCCYCRTAIIPPDKKTHRPAEIVVPKSKVQEELNA